MRNFILLILLTITLVTGCAPVPEITATPSETIPTAAIASPTPLPMATPSLTPTPLPLEGQQTEYHIDATINYYNRFISAVSRSVYTNKTNTPISEMVFIVYPTIFEAIFIRSVRINNGTPVDIFRWESHRMVLPLESPLLPGEQITITHEFELYMPERDGVFGQTGRQLLLSYWYPTIPPFTDDHGWLAYELSLVNSQFVGEYQTFESADFYVNIQFTDRQENLEIAAGALPVEKDGEISYFMPLARTFVLAISDSYTIIERKWNDTVIRGYSFPEVTESSEVAVDLTQKSLELYSELFGPYDRDVISVVQVDMNINMEFDGIFLIQSSFYWLYRNPPRSDLHIIVPHETSHQWFFSLVGNNQAMEPWLDEVFATYAEALFYERYFPDDLDWWWDTRVHAHLPAGSIDTTIYLPGGVPEYFNRVYRRGALFVQDLRDLLGDDAFFDFVKLYIREFRYDIATGEEFWQLLSQYTEADLNPLLDNYFTNPPIEP
jgi:hypothetical protein